MYRKCKESVKKVYRKCTKTRKWTESVQKLYRKCTESRKWTESVQKVYRKRSYRYKLKLCQGAEIELDF